MKVYLRIAGEIRDLELLPSRFCLAFLWHHQPVAGGGRDPMGPTVIQHQRSTTQVHQETKDIQRPRCAYRCIQYIIYIYSIYIEYGIYGIGLAERHYAFMPSK